MKKLNTFWISFQRSLLDLGYYRDIAKASYWFSFKYLLFLLICLSLVKTVQLGSQYYKVRNRIPSFIAMARKEVMALYPKELELRISNGKLFTNVPEPYFVEFPAALGKMDGKHLAVIDTKGIADDYPKYNTLVLATRQALVYPDKQQGGTTSTKLYYFSEIKRSLYIDYALYKKMVISLDPLIAKLPKFIDTTVVFGLIIFPIFGGLLWVSGTLFGLLFLTLFVWVLSKIVKTPYGYKTLFRLGMHGATWSILFTFLLDMTNQSVPYLYNLIFISWMAFVLFRIREQKAP